MPGFAYATAYSDLSPNNQEKVRNAELVVLPVLLENDLLTGEVFKYMPSVQPEAAAAVFFDYDQQYLFLPGMTSTRVLEWNGTKALVRHRINPIAFISTADPVTFQNWFFNLGAYSYDLDEEIHHQDETYTTTWAIPENRRVLGSEERGQIQFERMGTGTLISYENSTRPFMYDYFLKCAEGNLVGRKINKFLCSTAESYYERTVKFFEKRTMDLIQTGEIQQKIQHLNSMLTSFEIQ